MIKILFVCHGNICRSPMAEFVFKDMVQAPEKYGLSAAALETFISASYKPALLQDNCIGCMLIISFLRLFFLRI